MPLAATGGGAMTDEPLIMSSTRIRHELTATLALLEANMQLAGIWEAYPPAPERLMSDIPFCHDTLAFNQWLQWLFIPRLSAILEGSHPLPQDCAIAPIAEDALALIPGDTTSLLLHLQRIDYLIVTHANIAS